MQRLEVSGAFYIFIQQIQVLNILNTVYTLLTNKTTQPNPVDYCIQGQVNISQAKLRSEKFG